MFGDLHRLYLHFPVTEASKVFILTFFFDRFSSEDPMFLSFYSQKMEYITINKTNGLHPKNYRVISWKLLS